MLNYMKKYKKEIIFGSILAVQLMALLLYNMTKLRYQADFDSSSGMLQLAEIGRQKTFLIKDWGYQTTLGWDIPLVIAVLFYAVTKNVFLSMGIANNIIIIGYILVFKDILKRCGVKKINIMVSLILLFSPYTLGQLGYVPMLFTGTASYSIKLLITFLLIDLMIRIENNIPMKKNGWILALYLLLSLLSGISSGIYMLVSGIFPVMLYVFLKMLSKNNLRALFSMQMLVPVFGTIAFAIGVILSRLIGIQNATASMRLLSAEKMADNFLKCFVGIFELFGGVKDDAPVVFSLRGILCLVCLTVSVFLIFVIIYYVAGILKRREKRGLVGIVLCVVFVNLGVLLLADTTYSSSTFEYRYHIVGMVPAILLMGLFCNDLIFSSLGAYFKRFIISVLIFSACVISAGNFTVYYRQTHSARIDELQKITDIAEEQDISLVYLITTDGKGMVDGRLLRLCDFDIGVPLLQSHNYGITWGGSSRFFENEKYKGKILVVADQTSFKDLPHYITDRLKGTGSAAGYDLYVAEENILDCSTRLPENIGETAADFPYSPGYTILGEIISSGELKVSDTGGSVFFGNTVEPGKGIFDIQLNFRYEDGDQGEGKVLGKFGVYKEDGGLIREVQIIAGKECILEGVQLDENLKSVHYSVEASPHSGMYIQSIAAKKIKE